MSDLDPKALAERLQATIEWPHDAASHAASLSEGFPAKMTGFSTPLNPMSGSWRKWRALCA